MTLMRRSFILALMGLFALPSLALAQASDEHVEGAYAFVSKLSEDALAVLNDVTLTQEEREREFRGLLNAGFDMPYIGRIVLGRHNNKISDELKDEYDALFPEYVLKIYSRRLTEFGDEEFVVRSAAASGRRDVIVRSEVIRPAGGPPVAADWRVRPQGDDTYKIVDLKIEGISMVITQRDEFSSIINREGYEGLIAELRRGAALGDEAEAEGDPADISDE